MPLKFKLVSRPNLGEDKESIPQKVYTQIVCGDLVPFDEFVEEITDSSGVGSAGVKATFDRMNVVLARHLRHGRGVCAGELGIFRYYFGSTGVKEEKDFATNLIREPKVRFLPGKALRVAKVQSIFERVALPEKKEEDGPESEKPDEI